MVPLEVDELQAEEASATVARPGPGRLHGALSALRDGVLYVVVVLGLSWLRPFYVSTVPPAKPAEKSRARMARQGG